MRAAIYSRKSKFTGTGDSVENQVQICRDYLALNRPGCTGVVYEDEGFSGKSTNRPRFQQMLADIRRGGIDAVICYRLDRLSRSVSDFSQLLDLLQAHGIEFISVRESFDTSTPMGRAMINIASVFAQLERETIAERVRDNKLLIAREGRWQGGNPPLGLRAASEEYVDSDGKRRTVYYLVEDEEQVAAIREIFETMLRARSTVRLERALLQKGLRTPQGNAFSVTQLTAILRNPVYAQGAPCVYDYLRGEGCVLANSREEYDGAHGAVGYGKTKGERRRRMAHEEWIVALGRHRGLVSGEEWVAVQKLLDGNRKGPYRLQTSEVALFSGMLHCVCGAPMLVKGNRPDRDGKPLFYYKCSRKDRSRGENCHTANIRGPEFDREVLFQVKAILESCEGLGTGLRLSRARGRQRQAELEGGVAALREQLARKEEEADRVVLRMASANLSEQALALVESTLTRLSGEIAALKERLHVQEEQLAALREGRDGERLTGEAVRGLLALGEDAPVEQKRDLMKRIVRSVDWDGERFDLHLFAPPPVEREP